MSNESRCGPCTLCCKVLDVPTMKAPAGEDCRHCIEGKGCDIWEQRPLVCRGFICLWYANPQFGVDLRPDNCGVLFEPGGDRIMLANVDPARPTAWREGIAWGLVEKCLSEGTAVAIQVGTTKHFLLPQGQGMRDVWTRITNDARRRGFVG